MMDHISRLKQDYPWIQTPLVVGAPMRLIALADMAVEVSKAGGIGFIGAGTDVSNLSTELSKAKSLLSRSPSSFANSDFNFDPDSTTALLPIGIGFINWGASLADSLALIHAYRPAAVWFFAASSAQSLVEWAGRTREASPGTKVWVQIGSVGEAVEVVRSGAAPDVLVVQGTDAGGHGLVKGAGVVSLVPEVVDRLGGEDGGGGGGGGSQVDPIIIAAGGIADSRGLLAALALGASGVVLGTRLLASPEANISPGYKAEILRASDGGQTTVRTKVYDRLRGTNWAETHNARGVVNQSFVDAQSGMDWEENTRLYKEEESKGDAGWGMNGRMTTYAGSGVGLVKEIKPVGQIVREVREGVGAILERTRAILE